MLTLPRASVFLLKTRSGGITVCGTLPVRETRLNERPDTVADLAILDTFALPSFIMVLLFFLQRKAKLHDHTVGVISPLPPKESGDRKNGLSENLTSKSNGISGKRRRRKN